MLFLEFGASAFLFFYFYDLNTVFFQSRFGTKCFLAGALLLFCGTAGLIADALETMQCNIGFFVNLIISGMFLLLELYTLFWALPTEEAYSGTVKEKDRNSVCDKGMYALCRHPGVLWFAGFYLFLALALQTKELWLAAGLYTLLDLIYIILQDLVIFPRQFSNYDTYKKNTPFLIPTAGSVKRAVKQGN